MSSYDVTVIGGGAIGFGTVLGLQRRNPYLKIALIEKDDVDCRLSTWITRNNKRLNFNSVMDYTDTMLVVVLIVFFPS